MSRRTDGGPSKPNLPTGQPYGERKALQQFQQSGPMHQGSPLPTPTAGGGTSPPLPPAANLDVFAPTNRPNEPLTAGLSIGPGRTPILPADPLSFIRSAYAESGDPHLLEMLQDHGGQM